MENMDQNLEQKLKEKERKKQLLIADVITGFIALGVGALIFLLVFFLGEEGRTLKNACNASALSGLVLTSAGVLILLARLGAFDTFAFGFIQIGTSMFGKQPTKHNSLVEYKEEQYEKRKKKSKYYFVIIAVGGLFLIALAVLEILFNSMY